MGLRIWRLIACLLTALSMGAALAHLLEMPAKRAYPGGEWLHLLQTLYPPGFGTVGAAFEVGAVVSGVILVLLTQHRPSFGWTIVGALALLTMRAIFWIVVAPVNATLLPLTPETLPPNWAALCDQWEFGHAARAGLQLVALACFLWSILSEVPAGSPRAYSVDACLAPSATVIAKKSFAAPRRRP